MVKKLTAPEVLARRVRRAQVGRLKDQKISLRTRDAYTTAVHHFLTFVTLVGIALGTTVERLDMQLVEYIEYLWERGMSCSNAANTISGVQHFLGTPRNALTSAWSLLSVWRRHEIPIQAPPMPVLVLVGMASFIGHEGDWRLAASLALGFAACLRTDEMISLVVAHIEWGTNCLILYLETSKMMKRGRAQERIVVSDPLAVRLVRNVAARLKPSDTLMGLTARQFRAAFASCLAKLQLQGRYQPYSIRRGGATFLWESTHNMDICMETGRWSSRRTARLYIREAVRVLQSETLLPATRMALEAWSHRLT